MKRNRILLIFAALALTALGVFAVSAQDATATPLATTEAVETPVPEATAAVTDGTDDAESRPYLGIIFVDSDGSVLVDGVADDGAAAAAGIEAGDVITAIDGTDVTADSISDVLGAYAVGDTISVELTRGDETLTLEVVLGAIPESFTSPETRLPRVETVYVERPRLGITLADNEEGVIVSAVQPDSPAEAAGIEVDDVITAINGEAVTVPQEAAEAVAQAIANAVPGEFDVIVSVTRGGESLDLTATLVKPEAMMPDIPDFDFDYNFGGRGDRGFHFATPGLRFVPREGEEGVFDVVVPFTPADPDAVTPEVTEALAGLGIRLEPREDEEGVFDLILPAEALGGGGMGMMLPNLEGMLPDGLEFSFRGPRGMRFALPQVPDIFVPAQPDAVEGSI